MPRVSRKQAELNCEIIVEAATHLFRERGLHGISLSDVMAQYTMMVGAVTLARATRGSEPSEESLEAVRNTLLPVDSPSPVPA